MPLPRDEEAHAFAVHVVDWLQGRTRALTAEWLELLRERLDVATIRIFPDATLLNHIPDLLHLILRSVIEPDFGDLDEHALVQREVDKLARLRRAQGYTLDDVIGEFHTLRAVLHPEVQNASETWTGTVRPKVVLQTAQDIDWAVSVLARLTSRVYVDAAAGDREERTALLSAYGRAITHELRSRLNNAVLALDVYRQRRRTGERPEQADQLLDRLGNALEQLDGVAADVFSAIVSESRLADTPGRRLPLEDVVRETCDELALFADQREVRIVLADEYPSFQVDAPRLHVVLVNLLTNAVKYADPNKSERWVRIEVSKDQDPGRWRIGVTDNGIGISAALQETVFGRHIRAAASADQPGDGLGLTLAHEAVSQLGGKLWIESALGEGTTFAFTLMEPDAELTVASGER